MTVENQNVDQSLFNDAEAYLEETNSFSNDAPKDQEAILSLLVGEGKKYKTVEDALRSTVYKEDHIQKLQRENAELRAVAQKVKTTEELLQAIQNNKTTNVQNQDDNFGLNRTSETKTVPTTDEVLKQVLSVLEERRAKESEEANLQTVKNALVQQYGTRYTDALRNISNDLGMSQSEIDAMAKRTPKAFLKLAGVEIKDAVRNATPSPSAFHSQTSTNPSGDRGFKYYENLRKTNPKLWEKPTTQNEITQQAFKLGDRFYQI